MTESVEILTERDDVLAGVELWNERVPSFPIRRRLLEQNLYAPYADLEVIACGAVSDDGVQAFGVVKRPVTSIPDYVDEDAGWISLAVADDDRPGSADVLEDLLLGLESILRDRGVANVRFGADPQHFLPGVPSVLEEEYAPVLSSLGYEKSAPVYDLYRSLEDYEPPERVAMVDGVEARSVVPDEENDLISFLRAEFPGRWTYEAENVRRIPGGAIDYWLLWSDGEPIGFARANRAVSPYLGANVTWGPTLSPDGDYCGLGPIGIAADHRGNGFGLFLMNEIIGSFLRDGYEHMVIDWTGLLEYYAKLGFEPWRKYHGWEKERL